MDDIYIERETPHIIGYLLKAHCMDDIQNESYKSPFYLNSVQNDMWCILHALGRGVVFEAAAMSV